MFREVITGHDLREGGDDALALAKLIAASSGARLVVAGVFPSAALLPRGFEPRWREEEERVAAELDEIAAAAGAEPEGFPSSSPGRGLGELAEERDADLVVIGSSRHSRLGQVLAGNVGRRLLHGSSCAVAVAPRGYRDQEGGLDRVVVGFDGSRESRLALAGAAELALEAGMQLELIAALDLPPTGYADLTGAVWPDAEAALGRELQEQVDEAIRGLPGGLEASGRVIEQDPKDALAAAAAGDPGSLLVLGSRGYGPVGRVLLGSVSEALTSEAPAPVLVYPRPGPDE